jgi:hypothetical protein
MGKEVEAEAEVPLELRIRGRNFAPLGKNRDLLVPLASPAANLILSEKPPSPSPSSVLEIELMRQRFVFSSRLLTSMLAEDLIRLELPWVPDRFLASFDMQAGQPEKPQSVLWRPYPSGMSVAVAADHNLPEVAGSPVPLYNRKLGMAVQSDFVMYAKYLDWRFDSVPSRLGAVQLTLVALAEAVPDSTRFQRPESSLQVRERQLLRGAVMKAHLRCLAQQYKYACRAQRKSA